MKGKIVGHGEKAKYFVNGVPVGKDEFYAAFPPRTDQDGEVFESHSSWPLHSDAMAVHPKQLELARKLDRNRGAPPTEYDRQGRPVWTSEAHKREYNKAHGVHDNNTYF